MTGSGLTSTYALPEFVGLYCNLAVVALVAIFVPACSGFGVDLLCACVYVCAYACVFKDTVGGAGASSFPNTNPPTVVIFFPICRLGVFAFEVAYLGAVASG